MTSERRVHEGKLFRYFENLMSPLDAACEDPPMGVDLISASPNYRWPLSNIEGYS